MAPASAPPPRVRTSAHLLGATALLLWLCASAGALAAAPGPLHGARQLVLVTTADWDANQGVAARYERDTDAAAWRQIAAFPVSIGRLGDL